MFAQPLLFAAMALYRHADMRPRRFQLDRELLRRIMAAGFLVFLSGMLLQLGTLLERWFVGSVLGIETLGQLYLVILFTTLFQIVPTALDNVMLPRAIELSRTGQTSALRRTMRYFLLAIALYCAGVAGAVGLFAEPVLSLLVPERVGDLRHVHAILPGLVAFTMASPVAISFNVLIDYRGYMLAYGGGTLLTAVVLGLAAGRLLHLDIDAVMILRSACYGLMAAVLVAMFLQVSRRHPAFRFWRQ
jgi:O-antigen/teichoic acid export membrane protein